MALFLFTKAIFNKEPIQVFNNGKMRRDFTYIDDIIHGIIGVIDKPALPNKSWDKLSPDPSTSSAPYRLFNIGNNNPVELSDFIATIERATGIEATKNFLPMQPGDVLATYADIDDLNDYTGFKPTTSLDEGIQSFVNWYKNYYQIN
jgi:UDP-glucuronate 4-epimerase